MSLLESLKSRNFSVYAQWLGLFSISMSVGLGILNLFHIGIIVLFGAFSIVFGVILVFIELPFLLKICPTSEKFDTIIGRFGQNYGHAAVYLIFAVVDFLSTIVKKTSLIAVGIFLLLTAGLYSIAGLNDDPFHPANPFSTKDTSRIARSMVQ